jgi:predicted O-methyltransferase YrrM
MLERRNTPGYEALSKPCPEAIQILSQLRAEQDVLTVAEVGVGIGSSTVEFLRVMAGAGTLHLFDFNDVLNQLVADLKTLDVSDGIRVVTHGNGRQRFNGYAWTLATMAAARGRDDDTPEVFDFVYLDGAHVFHQDAPSCVLLKEMVKPGGYIVFDDMYWTFKGSPTMDPAIRPSVRDDFSDEQLSTPHVELVVDVFMRSDSRFEQVLLTPNKRPYRPVFRRLAVPTSGATTL